MTLVAGIDSSTQSCKVVVRDIATGEVVRSGRAPHPAGTEVDPAAWWDALLAAIDDAGGLAGVSALSVAGQQHGMVVMDPEGRVIRPALLWNDTRSAQAAKDLIAEVGAEDYAKRTGLVPVASFTATKLRWLRDNEPENAARVDAVVLPHDWLTWRLRGYGPEGESLNGPRLEELVTDRSDASGTGYWNPNTGRYDRELFERALGHPAILPRIMKPGAWGGESAKFPEQGIRTGRVIGIGAGDNAAAALGLGAGPGDVVVSIGTSGTVFAVTETVSADVTGTVAGFADATGAFLPLVATLNAARVLDAVAELLGVDHTELGRLALEAEPGAGGAVLQPYFEGSGPRTCPTRPRLCSASPWHPPPGRISREPPSRGCCAGSPTDWTRSAPRVSRPAASCSSAERRRTRRSRRSPVRCSTCPSSSPPPPSMSRSARRCRPPGR